MDKATFLIELQRNIGMLDDSEQKDIIDEYAQHIDMKVSNGMSEKEAIEDFGDFEDFVRDVLSAYHVKAPFDQAKQCSQEANPAPAQGEPWSEGRKRSAFASEAIKTARRCAAKATEATKAASNRISDLTQSHDENPMPAKGEPDSAPSRPRKRDAGRLLHPAGTIWAFFKSFLRWAWNAAVIVAALSALLAAIFFVFSGGVGLVLLAQGYPLVGLSVAFAGAAIAFGSLTYLLTRLIAGRKSDTPSSCDERASSVWQASPAESRKPDFEDASFKETSPTQRIAEEPSSMQKGGVYHG